MYMLLVKWEICHLTYIAWKKNIVKKMVKVCDKFHYLICEICTELQIWHQLDLFPYPDLLNWLESPSVAVLYVTGVYRIRLINLFISFLTPDYFKYDKVLMIIHNNIFFLYSTTLICNMSHLDLHFILDWYIMWLVYLPESHKDHQDVHNICILFKCFQ